MSYSDLKVMPGAKPFFLIEVDRPICANVYGLSPCTAVGPAALKCFNTYSTCQDKANYVKTISTITFCSNVGGLPLDLNAFPVISKLSVKPARLQLGKASLTAEVNISMMDFAHSDIGIDPYRTKLDSSDFRGYDARKQGSFFGRFLARNIYLRGSTVRVRRGFLKAGLDTSQGSPDLIDETFIIDTIELKNNSGQVSMVARDPLFLTNKKRAKVPKVSEGKLSGAYTAGGGSFTLESGDGAAYAASGMASMGTYAFTFTRSGDVFTITGNLTSSENKDAGSSVQEAYAFIGNVVDMVEDVITNNTDIDNAYIPAAKWATIKADWISNFVADTVIIKPMGVDKFLDDVAKQYDVFIVWDSELSEITLRTSVPPITATKVLTDGSNIIKGTVKRHSLPKEQVTRVAYRYRMSDPVEFDKEENFESVAITADLEKEGVNAYNAEYEDVINGYLNRSTAVATDVITKKLIRSVDIPEIIDITVDMRDDDVQIGDTVYVDSNVSQDVYGNPNRISGLVLSKAIVNDGSQVRYTITNHIFLFSRYGYFQDDSNTSYTSASQAERDAQPGAGWFSDGNNFADGGEPYRFS